MKLLGKLLACIMLCAGFSMFVLHRAASTIVTDDIISALVDQMTTTALSSISAGTTLLPPELQEQVDNVTSKLPEEVQKQVNDQVMEALPEEAKQQIESVKEELVNSKELQDLSQKYMDALLAGAIDGNSDLPDVNQDIQNLANTYVPKISEATGVQISQEQVQQVTAKLNEKVDLNAAMEQAVSQLHTSLSPSQKQALNLIRIIQGSMLLWVSIGLCIAAIVLLMLSTMSPIKWMPYAGVCGILSGGCMMLGSTLANMLLSDTAARFGTTIASIVTGVLDTVSQIGLWFGIMGIVLILVYALISFLRNHLVYE